MRGSEGIVMVVMTPVMAVMILVKYDPSDKKKRSKDSTYAKSIQRCIPNESW